jgi:hypothetical protein
MIDIIKVARWKKQVTETGEAPLFTEQDIRDLIEIAHARVCSFGTWYSPGDPLPPPTGPMGSP